MSPELRLDVEDALAALERANPPAGAAWRAILFEGARFHEAVHAARCGWDSFYAGRALLREKLEEYRRHANT